MAEYDKEMTKKEYLDVTHNMELHRRAVGLKPEITELEKSSKRGKAYMICIAFIWGGVMLSEFVRRVL